MSNLVVEQLNGTAVNRLTTTAWVNYDATGSITIRDSHNVLSIVDEGVGKYSIYFTDLMDNTNYSIVGLAEVNNTNLATNTISAYEHSLDRVRVRLTFVSAGASGFTDRPFCNVHVFGGKS